MNSNIGVTKSTGLKKGLFIITGTICLGLGAIGIILPILPTTPFLLLSAACYLRGSERMYHWLLTNKWFGAYIKNYREGKGIPLSGKISALFLLWLTISYSAVFLLKIIAIRIILFTIAVVVTIHIVRLPTFRKTNVKH